MNVIPCTYWRSLHDPVGQLFSASMGSLAKRFETPVEAASKTLAGGWAPVTFEANRRAKENVRSVSAIGLDFDELEVTIDELARDIPFSAIVHSTWSHTADAPRARAIIELDRPLSSAEHRRLLPVVVSRLASAGHTADPAAKDPSRLWFVPSVPVGKSRYYVFRRIEGTPLDVDATLASIPEVATPQPPPRPLDTRPMIADERHEASVIDRARKYLAKCDVAIAGQGGHNTTFIVAQKLVRSFGLDEGSAFELMSTLWNPSCQPPWSQADLIRKIQQAAKVGRMPIGALRDAPRRRVG